MPGLTFTTPDHALELLSRSNAASTKKAHQLPTFEAEHSEPILYLPPLLSSLPTTYPDVYSTRSTTLFPPIITETRLPDIDPASLSLHRALHRFRPVDDMYAAKPYSEAFNWDELELPEEEGKAISNIIGHPHESFLSRTRLVLRSIPKFAQRRKRWRS